MSLKGFPRSIEGAAFRRREGEYAWPREYVLRAVGALCARGYAPVRMEPQVVRNARDVTRARMLDGSEAPVSECHRAPGEDWDVFVERCARAMQTALEQFPEQQVALSSGDRVVYHLDWSIPRERREGLRDTGEPDSLELSAT